MNICTPPVRQNAPSETVAYTGPDRLSELPDVLLVKILSSLKPSEVAQTCILSKRWLKIWSYVPSLCFDLADFIGTFWRLTDIARALEKFKNFVSSFLLGRDEASHIHTFRLLCMGIPDSDLGTARNWVLYALKHNPKILQLSFGGNYSLILPDSVYTCETLEDVDLSFRTHDEDVETKRVCLPRLRNLKLSWANFSDDYLKIFLSGSPALESLIITGCKMYDFNHTVKRLWLDRCFISSGNISAPGVEILDFEEREVSSPMITLKGASKVTRANFRFSGAGFLDLQFEYSCNLLSSLSSVEHLLIQMANLKIMLESELPKCPTFFSLKNLTLGEVCMRCAFNAVSSFLNHCPKLEKLTLLHTEGICEVGGDHSGEESDENLNQIKGFPCEGLKTVEIMYHESDWTGHELYQLILKRTMEIEGVQIILTKHVEDN